MDGASRARARRRRDQGGRRRAAELTSLLDAGRLRAAIAADPDGSIAPDPFNVYDQRARAAAAAIRAMDVKRTDPVKASARELDQAVERRDRFAALALTREAERVLSDSD